MTTNIFQFNGCTKCFNETLQLSDVNRIDDPKSWNPEKVDISVLTGYLTPDDKEIVEKIAANSKKVIAYGSCTVTGGVYGLTYQKGNNIVPLHKIAPGSIDIHGCLGEIEELELVLSDKPLDMKSKVCDDCPRKSTCEYLDEVIRSVDVTEDDETCFNDLGFMCNGYVARSCKELCTKSGAPCRACKPIVERDGFRMLGMFGTLMGNIEVATEATGKGGTDKLADEPDDLTESIPDVTGNFFRFSLADSPLPKGRIESTNNLTSDLFIGRPIEELPMIMGLMGGQQAISFTLDILEAFEKGTDITVNDEAKEARQKLLELEKELQKAVENKDGVKYKEIEEKVREIAGNMNLSRLYFGGFRDSEPYIIDFEEGIPPGPYENGSIKFSLNSQGIVTEFNMEV